MICAGVEGVAHVRATRWGDENEWPAVAQTRHLTRGNTLLADVQMSDAPVRMKHEECPAVLVTPGALNRYRGAIEMNFSTNGRRRHPGGAE